MARQAPADGRVAALPRGAVECRRCRCGGNGGPTRAAGVGGALGRLARRGLPRDRARFARKARGGVGDRGGGDRQVPRRRARRDGRCGRDGPVRGRRRAALLRAHDDRDDGAPDGHVRAVARRRRRPVDLVQHAAPERCVEDLPGDPVRQRVRAEAFRAHAGLCPVLRNTVLQSRVAGRRAQRRAGARAGGRGGARGALGRRPGFVHRFGGDRSLGERDGCSAAGEGLSRAGRQERARRLRRRGFSTTR